MVHILYYLAVKPKARVGGGHERGFSPSRKGGSGSPPINFLNQRCL